MKTTKIILLVIIFLSTIAMQVILGILINREFFNGASLISIPLFAFVYFLMFGEMEKIIKSQRS